MRYFFFVLISFSALAIDVPTFQKITPIDHSLIVPENAPAGTYSLGASSSTGGGVEISLSGPANYIILRITSQNGATIRGGYPGFGGFPQFTPDFFLGIEYAPITGPGTTDVILIEFTDVPLSAGTPRNVIATKSLTFNIVNTPPIASLIASPKLAVVGGEVSFAAASFDADGHAVVLTFDYGDGSGGEQAVHVYSAPGSYSITVTANDGRGGVVTAQTSVTVVSVDHLPIARFTTSDIVAFVGVPFVVDGITSTDEQNSIVSFSWNFGDDSPLGSVPALSHVYKQTGTVIVTLVVTDAEGFTATLSREIEVLDQAAAATFDSEIRVASTFFPLKQNRDIVTVFARVNVGDTVLGEGSELALEYAGKRFTTTLGKRGKAPGWTVKQNLRRQAPGTVEITFKARNTAIAALLDGLGAIDDGTIDVPFRLELGPKTIQVDVQTDFEIGGARGKGAGAL